MTGLEISKNLLLAVVLAPLLGSIVAGLFGRQVGRAGAHWVTILGVATSCALVVMGAVPAGRAGRLAVQPEPVHLLPGRAIRCACRFHDRQADRDDDGGGDFRLVAGAYLHHRLHGRRSGLPALLQLYLAVHLLHADAGDEQQFPAAVLRLGSGRPGLVPADRILVQASQRDFRQPQGIPGQPGRRFRFPAGHCRVYCSCSARWTTPGVRQCIVDRGSAAAACMANAGGWRYLAGVGRPWPGGR